MWMLLSVLYMVVRPFVTRPIPFNSVVAAFVGVPLISDDIEWVCFVLYVRILSFGSLPMANQFSGIDLLPITIPSHS